MLDKNSEIYLFCYISEALKFKIKTKKFTESESKIYTQ